MPKIINIDGTPYTYNKDIEKLKDLARRGDLNALVDLAHTYRRGEGIKQNCKLAVDYHLKIIEKDKGIFTINSINDLAWIYFYGEGNVGKDINEALHYFNKGVEMGDRDAMWNLGVIYYNGKDVKKDYKLAFNYFSKSVEGGDLCIDFLGAQYMIAKMHDQGLGTAQNHNKAMKWYKKVAYFKNNEPEFEMSEDEYQLREKARRIVGYYSDRNKELITCNMDGTPWEEDKVAKWYIERAEQGDADAQFHLAYKYKNGKGVPSDESRAVYWYHQAAKQGHVESQFFMGQFYESGSRGVKKDKAEAVYWYRKAAKQGHTGSENKYNKLCSYYF